MRVVYMGTPDFAVPSLQKLIDDKHEILLVVTQPDKPKGRKQILTPPPVKELALEHGIEVYQPASMKTEEAFERLNTLKPDVIIVAAYGKILPKAILDIPRYGCVNLHGSILPKYRGAAPIQWAVINGETKTGITTMQMNEGLDTGDILLCETLEIGENETAGEVFDRLAALCPPVLEKTLELIEVGKLKPIKQNDDEASYAPMLNKEMSLIDWDLPADVIHNKIRGLSPWPLAISEVAGKRVKLFSSLKTGETRSRTSGVFFEEKDGLFAVCGDGKVLFLPELQADGSKKMASRDFLKGHKI